MSGKRILLVDDSEADHFVAELVVENAGLDVTLVKAYDGEEALEILDREGTASFDVILLDINMPRMDGHEFLEAFCATRPECPPVIVMLTSSDQDIDRQRCASFPCVQGYQIKPLTEEWLRSIL